MRGMAYKRLQREKHIKRKESIIRAQRPDNPPHIYEDKEIYPIHFKGTSYWHNEGNWIPYWVVNHRGQLNKGKIHCGCGLCMAKTRNKGNRRKISRNYAPSINYKISEWRKIEKMNWDEKNWEQELKDIEKEELFNETYFFLKNKISEELYNMLKESDK